MNLETSNDAWLTPLLHMIEPPVYSESSTNFQRMGKRTWVDVDGGEFILPSLMDRPSSREPESRSGRNAPAIFWLSIDGGPSTAYRSVWEAFNENEVWESYNRSIKIRQQLIDCKSACLEYKGRELFFWLGR
ncbi:hypothetical protein PWR63_19385 [Paraburkholderia sp. A2WS-5]|uniref:hypothetical protein n=1 Tax=unclassified Paraburkholderia TaxID=2615204 RepID=UPI003B76B6CE